MYKMKIYPWKRLVHRSRSRIEFGREVLLSILGRHIVYQIKALLAVSQSSTASREVYHLTLQRYIVSILKLSAINLQRHGIIINSITYYLIKKYALLCKSNYYLSMLIRVHVSDMTCS
jgi:hypothetical protein